MSKQALIVIALVVVVIALGSVMMFKKTMEKGMIERENRVLDPKPPKPAPAK